MTKLRGFTLIEVLVALSIVAIALMAGIRASSALADNTIRQSEVFLAQLCAENEQIKVRLSRQLPGIGDTRSECIQSGQTFVVNASAQTTPNPNFRKFSVSVSKESHAVFQLSAVVGNN
jgi:general secretion pathway protein I